MLGTVQGVLATVKDTPSLTMAVMGLILLGGALAYNSHLMMATQEQIIQVVKENTESGVVLRSAVMQEAKDTAEIVVYLKSIDDRLRRRGI